jgi:hypothetical protein
MPQEVDVMLNGEKLVQGDFDKALQEAIDEGFSLLGHLPREVILRNLEASFQMKEEEIPQNLARFKVFLETTFGAGSRYMEGIIINRLCQKLNLPAGNLGGSGLGVSVDEVKQQLLSGVKISEQDHQNTHR